MCVDVTWIYETFPALAKVPVTIVHGEDQIAKMEGQPASWALHLPKFPRGMPYSGSIHGKIFLLGYSTRLRVVISTANLLMEDYDRKTQALWYQDFPLKDPSASQSANDFEETLCDFLTTMQLPQHATKLRAFDFSSAKVVLISSVPGYHGGQKLHQYGHMKLRRFLSAETFAHKFRSAPIACQTSSLGNSSGKWLQEFIQSFSAGRYLPAPIGEPSANGPRSVPPLHLIWPTEEFVRSNIDGYMAGGSLFFSSRSASEEQKQLLCLYDPPQPGRKLVPPHIKSYVRHVALTQSTDDATSPPAGATVEIPWALVTSANFSKAAWGQLQKSDTQLMILNFEIGVLFLPQRCRSQPTSPVPRFYAGPEASIADPAKLCFPYPSSLPPRRYSNTDRPWISDEAHIKPDNFGVRINPNIKQ
jgi:tyrosyl-DNA phosphodiesterase-1